MTQYTPAQHSHSTAFTQADNTRSHTIQEQYKNKIKKYPQNN